MKWIVVTRISDGEKIYVNANRICAIYRKYNSENATIIDFGEDFDYLEVLESPESIMNLIKAEE